MTPVSTTGDVPVSYAADGMSKMIVVLHHLNTVEVNTQLFVGTAYDYTQYYQQQQQAAANWQYWYYTLNTIITFIYSFKLNHSQYHQIMFPQ